MWREEKMQFCADIGMSGRRRREKGGMGENKGAWNDFDRVRCQNTMIGSLTRMGRRANRFGEKKSALPRTKRSIGLDSRRSRS